MNKKIILVIILFLSVLLLSFFAFFNQNKSIKEDEKIIEKEDEIVISNEDITICDEFWETFEKYQCISKIQYKDIYDNVDKNNDFNLCNNIKLDNFEEDVIKDCKKSLPLDLAVKRNDPELCKQLLWEWLIERCELRVKYNYVFLKWYKQLDSSVCNEIPLIDDAHKELFSFCNDIISEVTPVIKEAVCWETPDISKCYALDNSTWCIEAVNSLSVRYKAVSTLDSDKCSELKNFKEKQLCC